MCEFHPLRLSMSAFACGVAFLLAVPATPAFAQGNGNGSVRPDRRPIEEGQVKLAFKNEPVDDKIFSFIAESTGKVVMPVNLTAIKNRSITLLNDEWIERSEALDLLFRALRLNSIGVIEKDDVVIIGMIDEIVLIRQMPVINADTAIMDRRDLGSLVVKVFQLHDVPATGVGEQLQDAMPSYATLTVDEASNQIIVTGDIALAQHVQLVIDALDHPYIEPKTQTFRLAYADAQQIADTVIELYEPDGSSGAAQPRGQRTQRGNRPQPGGADQSAFGQEIELRVAANIQQNSLTVVGDPVVVDHIAVLIADEWDLPRAPGTSRIYTLQYVDPLVVKEKLDALLGGGGTSGGGASRGGAQAGGGAGVQDQLIGIYSIEAYPDTSQLFVFSKTEESFTFLDDFINAIDQPTTIGLPFVVELKHADAVDLSQELNALLSEPGVRVSITLPDDTLAGRQTSEEGTTGTEGGGAAGEMTFPWQQSSRGRDEISPESSLIGKVRLVPIIRQNAIAVLCPQPQREAVRELIDGFDKAGRQVMISAVIAEVELNDDLALGLRFSSADSVLASDTPDNQITGIFDSSGTKDNNPLGDFFSTSILDAAIPVRIAIQALQQNTNVRILQQPVIFTADNQEALFFDGQDIPFITQSTINDQGNSNDSFDYREVGVVLNVRPRITVNRDVDLELILELSSIVPGQTLFGGAIIDRRETRTHVVVKDGQTIVISGILRDTESNITRKIPLLGDIPFIGELFTSRDNSTTRTELIAFITPSVADNPDENDDNFQEGYRARLDEMTRPLDTQLDNRKDDPERYDVRHGLPLGPARNGHFDDPDQDDPDQ